jgi:hypothetical protein
MEREDESEKHREINMQLQLTASMVKVSWRINSSIYGLMSTDICWYYQRIYRDHRVRNNISLITLQYNIDRWTFSSVARLLTGLTKTMLHFVVFFSLIRCLLINNIQTIMKEKEMNIVVLLLFYVLNINAID